MRKSLIFLFCLFFSFFTFSQNYGTAVYSIKPAYNDKEKVYEEPNDSLSRKQIERKNTSKYVLSSAWQAASELEFELVFDENQSISKVVGLDNENKNYVQYRNAMTFVGGNFVFYQNKAENISFVEKENRFLNEIFLVQEDLFLKDNRHSWIISEEKKQIGGYLCTKATREYFYKVTPDIEKSYQEEVWFTSEIPLPFGPSGYGGLPGLVVEASKFKGDLGFTLTLDKIKSKKKPKINKPNGGKIVSTEEYFEIEYNSAPEKLRKKHTLNMKLNN